jgi:hypothetical protein
VRGGTVEMAAPKKRLCTYICGITTRVGVRYDLTAKPKPGYRFARWRNIKACTSKPHCVFVVRDSADVVAVFTKK